MLTVSVCPGVIVTGRSRTHPADSTRNPDATPVDGPVIVTVNGVGTGDVTVTHPARSCGDDPKNVGKTTGKMTPDDVDV